MTVSLEDLKNQLGDFLTLNEAQRRYDDALLPNSEEIENVESILCKIDTAIAERQPGLKIDCSEYGDVELDCLRLLGFTVEHKEEDRAWSIYGWAK